MLEIAITNDGLLKPEILNEIYDESLEFSNIFAAYLSANKKKTLRAWVLIKYFFILFNVIE